LKNESAIPTTSVSSSVFTNSLGAALMKTSLARTAEKRTRELIQTLIFPFAFFSYHGKYHVDH
jgi:hypothetical protein